MPILIYGAPSGSVIPAHFVRGSLSLRFASSRTCRCYATFSVRLPWVITTQTKPTTRVGLICGAPSIDLINNNKNQKNLVNYDF